jgi:cell division protein FtsW
MNFKNFAKLVIIGIIVLIPISFALKGQIFSEKRVDRFAVIKDPFAVEQTSGYHWPIHIWL